MAKISSVNAFTYRDIRWISGKMYRNSVFIFRKAYDSKTKVETIQYAVEYKDIAPPYKTRNTRWADFCNVIDAKDLV